MHGAPCGAMRSPQLFLSFALALPAACTGDIYDRPSARERSPDPCEDCVSLVDAGVEPPYDVEPDAGSGGRAPAFTDRGPTAAIPFETCVSGDGLCGASCSIADDDDCPAVCGDGILSLDETCDSGDAATACPTSCPPSDDVCVASTLEGDPASCDARCVTAPVVSCTSGDGCCPGSCTASEDADCPIDCTRPETWPTDWVRFEDRVLTLTNARRAAGASCGGHWFAPAGPVRMEARLRQTARCHSVDMGETGVLDHVGSDGSQFWDRMSRAGYTGYPVAENVAGGYVTPEELVAGWMSSTGHCENIMTASANEIGIGYAESPRGYQLWSTQVFGRR